MNLLLLLLRQKGVASSHGRHTHQARRGEARGGGDPRGVLGRTRDALQYIGDESNTVKMQFLSSQSFPAAPDVTSQSYQNVQYGRAFLFLATPLSRSPAATQGLFCSPADFITGGVIHNSHWTSDTRR